MREIVLASALREYYPITQKAFLICDQERSEKTIYYQNDFLKNLNKYILCIIYSQTLENLEFGNREICRFLQANRPDQLLDQDLNLGRNPGTFEME